jgi:hypothetical protein
VLRQNSVLDMGQGTIRAPTPISPARPTRGTHVAQIVHNIMMPLHHHISKMKVIAHILSERHISTSLCNGAKINGVSILMASVAAMVALFRSM